MKKRGRVIKKIALVVAVFSITIGHNKAFAEQSTSTSNTTKEETTNISKVEASPTVTSESQSTEKTFDENLTNNTEQIKDNLFQYRDISPRALSQGLWGTSRWSLDTDTGIFTFGSGVSGGNTSKPAQWSSDKSSIKKIVFDGPFSIAQDSAFLGSQLSSVTSIEGISNVSISNRVKTLNGMFAGWSSLEELDLSSFNFSGVSTKSSFLSGTTNLKRLTLPSSFRSENNDVRLPQIVPNNKYTGNWVKEEDPSIKMGNSSQFISEYDGTNPGTYIWEEKTVWGDVPYEYDKSTGTITFTAGGTLGTYASSPWNRPDAYKVPGNLVKKIIFTQPVAAPENSNYLFSSTDSQNFLIGLESIDGLSMLNTSNVTNMNYMFRSVSTIKSLDVSTFASDKVTTMYGTFIGMTNIESLNLKGFKTSNVSNMGFLFSGLRNIEELNLGEFDFSKTTYKLNMFSGNTRLKKIVLPPTFTDSSNSVRLPNIVADTSYTGNWIEENNPNVNVGNSTDFISNYDGSKSGSYVWETRPLWGSVPFEYDKTTGTITFLSGGTLGTHASSPWNRSDVYKIKATDVKKIVFKEEVIAPENSIFLFSDGALKNLLTNLKSIDGLNLLDTSNVTNMQSMFYNAQSLSTIDLSKFNTSKVTDMSSMFNNALNLSNLDLSHFDTSQVASMYNMFGNTASLKKVNLSSFNTSKVVNMTNMFNLDSYIEELDLSNFDFNHVTQKNTMFGSMTRLKKITLPSSFKDSDNLTRLPTIKANSVYSGNWIREGNPNINMGTSSNFMNKFDGTIPGSYVWETRPLWGDVPYEYDKTAGTVTFLSGGNLGTQESSPWNRSDIYKTPAAEVKKIAFQQAVTSPNDSRFLFSSGIGGNYLSNMTEIDGLNLLDTSKVTSMYAMFYRTDNLENINLSNFTTTNVTSMSYMFSNTRKLTNLDLSSFDTSRVTDMSNMFANVSSLRNLNVSNFNTSRVTNMSGMFNGSVALTSIDVSKFNTSQVINASHMFNGLSSVAKLDLGSFDFTKISDKSAMLGLMSNLKNLTLPKTFSDPTNSVQLPEITKSVMYSGNWMKENNRETVGTSQQFMSNYKGIDYGTYVWEEARDPLNVSSSNQTDLVLTSVPSLFLFQTNVGNNTAEQKYDTGTFIKVYNNRLDRSWNVRAQVIENSLTTEKGTKLPVTSFKINNAELVGTGSNGVIARSANNKTIKNNIGTISTKISSTSITFDDPTRELKSGNRIMGTVRYQLYNVVGVE